MQQDGSEARRVAYKAVEEQERSARQAAQEGIGSIARLWSGPDCSNSGMSFSLFPPLIGFRFAFLFQFSYLGYDSSNLLFFLFPFFIIVFFYFSFIFAIHILFLERRSLCLLL